ncbi:hypothetical protein [Nitratireductor sp. OM-1]|uniref:hypothetical protein n=1 Tax=Nitratireductor sp. OM-1 TaxID=1756988 RepID=UPI0013AFB1E4|nr:hypothetical protein [Nitratireductor sp. OM-1]
MALTDPEDTLAYHQSRVLTAHRDMSSVPLPTVADRIEKYLVASAEPKAVPETEALWFYGMNHAVATIQSRRAPLEPLDEWELSFVRGYHELMGEKAVRAFYYLMLICTRESRHNKSLIGDLPYIKQKFGAPVASFLQSVNGGESGIHKALVTTPPQTTLGNYVECLRWQFYNSKWHSGYGGKAWGQVTDCLARFVSGEFTAEMMLDTVWTLSHNNGPIFNKGLCYQHYHAPSLIRILDIQRSGQIPEAILHDPVAAKYSTPIMRQRMDALAERVPEIGSFVDWVVVEALGSVQSYAADIKKQTQTHGISEAGKHLNSLKAAKILAEIEKAAQEDAEFSKKWLTIMPDVHVEKIQRAA